MTYFTLTMIELISIIAICFWMQCKREYTPNPAGQNYNTGYNDSSIPGSTVLMSADDWDKQHGRS